MKVYDSNGQPYEADLIDGPTYRAEVAQLAGENATLRAEIDQWASRCASAIYLLPGEITGGQLRDAQNKFFTRLQTAERNFALARAALRKIALEDYRGNMPNSIHVAATALREIADPARILTSAEKTPPCPARTGA